VQVESNEAEVEGLLAAMSKKAKAPPARVDDLAARNKRHRLHTERLEQVQRALDNEAVSVEQVDGLKDDLADYIVRCLPLPLRGPV
jgi:CCR4-NOT transcriptional regulation complex NOT5 subunit